MTDALYAWSNTLRIYFWQKGVQLNNEQPHLRVYIAPATTAAMIAKVQGLKVVKNSIVILLMFDSGDIIY